MCSQFIPVYISSSSTREVVGTPLSHGHNWGVFVFCRTPISLHFSLIPSFQTLLPWRVLLSLIITDVHRSGLFNLILGKEKVESHRKKEGSKLWLTSILTSLTPWDPVPFLFLFYLPLLTSLPLSTSLHVPIQLVIPNPPVLPLISWNCGPLRGHFPALPYGAHTPVSSNSDQQWGGQESHWQTSVAVREDGLLTPHVGLAWDAFSQCPVALLALP